MSLLQILRIVREHWKVELAVFLGTFTVALLAINLVPKEYAAVASIYIDVRTLDPVSAGLAPGTTGANYVATQVDILRSDRVAQKVVEDLNLVSRSQMLDRWASAAKEPNKLLVIADELERKLDVRQTRESSVLNVAYLDRDPKLAAEIANAFVKVYLDLNLELKRAPALMYVNWFDEQTRSVRSTLEKAQERLSDYQQSNGIIPADERIDVELARLNEISMQTTRLLAQTAESASKRGTGDTVAEVMQSPLITALKTDIARMEASIQEKAGNWGPNHPQMIRARQELSSLQMQLAQETRNIGRSIDTSLQVSRRSEQDLKGALEAQRKRVLHLNKQRDELNILKRDLESAQKAYEAVTQRASQVRLESMTDQTNITRLSEATEPLRPVRSRVTFYAVALVASLALALMAGLIIEMLNKPVRSTDDLAYALGLPVLGSLSHSRPQIDASKWMALPNDGPQTGRGAQ